MPYFYFDYYYLILVVPALLLAIWAQVQVKTTYRKYSRVPNSRGMTGAYAAQAVLNFYGITDVRIERVSGNLTDHYDPRSKVIRLSDGVYNSSTVAAIGIACHEAGHAAQHAENYAPIKIRNAIIPVCNIGSTIGIPLALIGWIFSFSILIYVGLGLYAAVFIFQVATLPVEFNASRRAIKVIDETQLLRDDEIGGAKKVLAAAAMTYVASMMVSLANLLRLLLRFSNNRRD
ncbi:peptidase membrane zinc metallopeptidase [Clostridium sp. CAG:413]|jgi:Zn-dependent membrane protease YugP|nr:zinc metallopeptidase [Clostridium sp.]CDC12719.1 peptidase membrane zinc metallopeptidase [Clostridium sp. CAG:413]